MNRKFAFGFLALGLALGIMFTLAFPVMAGDCSGYVVDVRPVNKYDHAAGNGFLAVRTGPGSSYKQVGELYLGDEIWVGQRKGRWLYVGCMEGRCARDPLWGPVWPEGWAYDAYLDIGGICP